MAFTCVNPLLFLLLSIMFNVLLPCMNYKFNFGLNFNTMSLFSLKLQNFIWFPSYQRKIIKPLRISL